MLIRRSTGLIHQGRVYYEEKRQDNKIIIVITAIITKVEHVTKSQPTLCYRKSEIKTTIKHTHTTTITTTIDNKQQHKHNINNPLTIIKIPPKIIITQPCTKITLIIKITVFELIK